jgi:hypothetical protein
MGGEVNARAAGDEIVERGATAAALQCKDRDAEEERAIVARLSPFFDARIFAEQFGTQTARDQMMEGLKKAGFR